MKNSEFKKYVDITLKKDSHVDFSEFKKELDKTNRLKQNFKFYINILYYKGIKRYKILYI